MQHSIGMKKCILLSFVVVIGLFSCANESIISNEPIISTTCSDKDDIACLTSPECTYVRISAKPLVYACREAQGKCEIGFKQFNEDEDSVSSCESKAGCLFKLPHCFCPQGAGVLCYCGGGTPPMCIEM